MSRRRGQWEYRGHWIDDNVASSDNYYVYWYEFRGPKRRRKVCRKSLKTSDFEEAQDALIQFVLSKETDSQDALVISVLNRYIKEVTAGLPSSTAAERAAQLLAEMLDGTERVSDLSETFQRDSILKIWRETHGHSVGYTKEQHECPGRGHSALRY